MSSVEGSVARDPIEIDSGTAGLSASVAHGHRVLVRAAAVVAFLLLPVTMTVANKSSPLLLGVAAVLLNIAALRDAPSSLLRRYRDLLAGRSGLLVLAVIALAMLSIAWSSDRAMTERGLREALPEVVFAFGFAVAGVGILQRRDITMLRYGLLLGAAAIGFEAAAGMPLHHVVGTRAEPYDLKWSALTLALLLWPAIETDLQTGRRSWAVAVTVAVAAAAVAAHSSTALCAIVISALAFGASRLAPRATLLAFTAFLLVALVVPPWFGQLTGDVISPRLRTVLEQQHAEHRIEIWTSFGRRIGERPWLGHGFNSSFSIGRPDHPDEAAILERHPHNVFLQVWIEFGIVGVIGMAAAIGLVMSGIRRLPSQTQAVRLAQLATVTVLALVWQNPWRPWWLAAIGLAMALFLIERERGVPPGPPRSGAARLPARSLRGSDTVT